MPAGTGPGAEGAVTVIGFDFSPLLQMLVMAALLGGLPLAWAWRKGRGAPHRERLRLLTVLAMTLTFELILVGAFTRLTDSGLGCPDWPLSLIHI